MARQPELFYQTIPFIVLEETASDIQWHPAFYEAIQLELEEYRDVLIFEIERDLTAAPLKIDVLIIRKRRNIIIKKNIAQIFQQYNIVEYKSPDDYISLNDYNKVRSYALLYASQQNADTDELSVTFISDRKPIKLLKHLAERLRVEQQQPGIYIVSGDICPLQIIVSRELSDDENLWINGLTKHLTKNRLNSILNSVSIREKDTKPGAYIDVITSANENLFKELTMGQTFLSLCEKYGVTAQFEARGRVEGRVEGRAEGKRDTIVAILRKRFKRVPKTLETAIRQLNDPTVLESFAVEAAVCNSLAEFEKGLK